MSTTQPFQHKGFVRLPAILRMIPIGRSTWWAGVKDGRFPKPVKLGKRTTAWRIEDIQDLMRTFQPHDQPLERGPVAVSASSTRSAPDLASSSYSNEWVQRIARKNEEA